MTTLCKIFLMVLISIGLEIFLVFIYWLIGMYKMNKTKEITISIIKGLLERGFLSFCLVINLPISIALFGALKIGTRLDNGSKSKLSNDLFLVGNILSVFIAIIYFLIWKKLFT